MTKKVELDKGGSKKEYIIQREILEYLHTPELKEVCFVFRQQTVGVFDPSTGAFRVNRGVGRINGVADIIGLVGVAGCDVDGLLGNGRFLAIEVKAVRGKLTPDQTKFLIEVNNRGGIGIVARSVEDVKEALMREGVLKMAHQ